MAKIKWSIGLPELWSFSYQRNGAFTRGDQVLKEGKRKSRITLRTIRIFKERNGHPKKRWKAKKKENRQEVDVTINTLRNISENLFEMFEKKGESVMKVKRKKMVLILKKGKREKNKTKEDFEREREGGEKEKEKKKERMSLIFFLVFLVNAKCEWPKYDWAIISLRKSQKLWSAQVLKEILHFFVNWWQMFYG